MIDRHFVSSRVLALVLPATLGLSCIQRDWSVCSPQDQCQTGYTCTADWKCVRDVDGGSDGLPAADSHGTADAVGAGVDGPMSVWTDGPAGAATGPDAPGPSASPDAAVNPVPGLDGSEPDRVPVDVSVDAPVSTAPDAPAVESAPDAPAADSSPDAPAVDSPHDPPAADTRPDAQALEAHPSEPTADAAGTCSTDKDCSGGSARLCDTSTNHCVACLTRSDCTGACQTCSNGLCTAVKNQDDPSACPGTCDAAGACKSKQGQTCQRATDCADGIPCADGYCCNKACTGSCEACDVGTLVGTCTTLGSSATPRASHGPCATSDATCTGKCDGKNAACSYPPSTTTCGSAFCSGSSYQAAGTCGNGACNTPDLQPCTSVCVLSAGGCVACAPGTKQCSTTGVPQLCLANGTWQDQTTCVAGNTCSSGTCVCTKTTFYRDADGDGYGTVLSPTTACSAPAGYVSNSGDCDDGNGSIHPGYAICNTNDRYYCDTDGSFKTAICGDGCFSGTCRSDGTVGLAGWVSCGTDAVRCTTSQGCSAPYGGGGTGSCGIPANPVYALSCDGPNDCPSGQTCCYDSFQAGSVRTFCNAGTTCPPNSVSDAYTPVCDPLSPQCPYPKTCKLDRGFYSCLE
jgi:hypothetical protein